MDSNNTMRNFAIKACESFKEFTSGLGVNEEICESVTMSIITTLFEFPEYSVEIRGIVKRKTEND